MAVKLESSRRDLLKTTAGAIAIAVGGGTPFVKSTVAWAEAKNLAREKLSTIGVSVSVQERILSAFKEASGVGAVSGTTATFPDAQTRILSGSTEYDCWETMGERIPALVSTSNAIPIPSSALPHWTDIRETFLKPDPKFATEAQVMGQIWADKAQTKLWMVPTIYNFDSVGYDPDVVSADEASSWAAIFDEKWKGRAGLNTDPLMAMGEALLAMNSTGLMEVKNPGNPTKKQIDEAIKFLIAKKKAKQFRALWGDFGELVNYLASGEIVISDAWQPAIMAVRAQGKAARYAVPKEGYRAWAYGVSHLKVSKNPEAVLAYADYWLSGPPSATVSEQGYYSPTRAIKGAMKPEKYAFWYEGKPWVGAPERGIAEGEIRDGGSLETRSAHVAYWHQWPDEYDYLVQRWDEFLTA